MTLARRVLPDAAAAALLALAVFAFFGHAFLNYDGFYALVWGDDLAHGRQPRYDVPVGPTPHPLLIALGALLSPLGDSAEAVVLALVLLSFGAICVGLFRLGAEVYAWPVGLLAAAIFATRVPPLNFAIRGYVDFPTIALIVWAAVLEARSPRRGVPVLVLLGVAGLLRPEAWGFAVAYWLWLGLPLRLLPLAAAAPVLWMVSDLLVTGDALWSLHGTSELAADLGRRTGLTAVPEVMPRRLGEILRLPELVAAVIGFGAALWWLRERTLLPAAIAVLNGLAFCAFGVAGLPLLGRYLFLAGAILSLFAAVAVFGWMALPEERESGRRAWRIGGAVILLAILAFFPVQAGRLGDLRNDIAARDRVLDDLHDLVKSPPASSAIDRCSPLLVPNHRPVPELAYWTDTRPAQIRAVAGETITAGALYLEPATPEVARLSILDPRDPAGATAERPRGLRDIARNRSWILAAGPACRPG